MTKEERLGSGPLGPLIFEMVIPAVIAQLVNVLYSIVDRIYIGHMEGVGREALTGVGVCFPILMLISAFSAFAGMGGAPRAAISLGRGEHKMAERILGNAVLMLFGFSLILTVFFSVYKKPLLMAFGASSNTIGYSLDYLDIYLLGTIFVQFSLGLNMFITCQGQAKISMISVMLGAGSNIILDPFFIFGLGMGVRGAALATIISQALSCIWILSFLCSSRSSIRIRMENLVPDRKILGSIAALGIAPFVMQSTESLVTIVLNSGLQRYGGDLYVGTITIMQSVMQLIIVPLQGVQQGTQPVISYNFGAGNKERIKKTMYYSFSMIFSGTLLSCLATCIFPEFFASFFTTDQELIALVGKVMPVFMGGIWMFGIQLVCQSAFMGMGQAGISLFLALLRKIFLLIPLALVLPKYFGVYGIYYAEPIADILAPAITGILFLSLFSKIIEKEAKSRMGEKYYKKNIKS